MLLVLLTVAASAIGPRPSFQVPHRHPAALPQDSTLQLLRSARGLRCTFGSGTFIRLDQRSRHGQPDSLLAPLIFDQIDHTARHARVVDSEGGSDVSVVDLADGISFIEVAPLGLSVYTVFATLNQNGEFLAVLSGHISAPQPISQTLYGSCRVAH